MQAGSLRVRLAVALAVVLAIPVWPSLTAAEAVDTTPPEVVELEVSPAVADTTDDDAHVVITMRVTDAGSGIADAGLQYERPDGATTGVGMGLRSGDPSDAVYANSFYLKWGSPPGDYTLSGWVRDAAGNHREFTTEDLLVWGLHASFHVTNSDPDTGPPVLLELSGTPSTVDVREGSATLDLVLRVSDDRVGVSNVSVHPRAPDGSAGGVASATPTLGSGDAMDGTWTGTVTIPEHTREGRWELRVSLGDGIYDALLTGEDLAADGLQSGFDVLSIEDLALPEVMDGTISPEDVHVDALPQTVTMRFRVTDELAGLSSVYVILGDPCCLPYGKGGYATRISGDAHDGWYEKVVDLPDGATQGRWRVWIGTTDAVQNHRNWFSSDLEPRSIVSEFAVYGPPSAPPLVVADGHVGAVRVRWDVASDGGAVISSYVVRESPQGRVVSVSGTARRDVVIDGLAPGKHRVTVESVNKAGSSAPSSPVAFTVLALEATTTTSAPSTVETPEERSGYWMADAAAGVYAFGDAGWFGGGARNGRVVDIEATPSRDGYWIVDVTGSIFAYGDAAWLGHAYGALGDDAVVSLSATPTGQGYWLFTSKGRVLSFGDAGLFGDMAGTALNGPVLDSIATPTGQGYYMVASDGGVFAFGDARFAGSMGAVALNAPVQSLVPDTDGTGYWLVASDGGIFAFSAPFHGSMGGVPLNRPVVGMVGSRSGDGYLMVAEDGGIFAFGDVPFHGSLGASPPLEPVVAVAAL